MDSMCPDAPPLDALAAPRMLLGPFALRQRVLLQVAALESFLTSFNSWPRWLKTARQ
ncbi:MAG: hypothetical protein ABI557_10875 [Aureliella sp.]